jgi:hypothetical protein
LSRHNQCWVLLCMCSAMPVAASGHVDLVDFKP